MSEEHPLLTAIRNRLATSGTHSEHWGDLRRGAFPGEASWRGLKEWCAANAFECELAFGQSSKHTQVQFRTQRRAPAAPRT